MKRKFHIDAFMAAEKQFINLNYGIVIAGLFGLKILSTLPSFVRYFIIKIGRSRFRWSPV